MVSTIHLQIDWFFVQILNLRVGFALGMFQVRRNDIWKLTAVKKIPLKGKQIETDGEEDPTLKLILFFVEIQKH